MDTGVYPTSHALKGEKQRLLKEEFSKEIKDSIVSFVNYVGSQGVSNHRQYFYMVRLRLVAQRMGDKFLKPTEQDLVDLINELRNSESRRGSTYTENTLNDFRVSIKRFYRWYYTKVLKTGNVEELLSDLKKTNKKSNVRSEELITQQEVRDMAAQCKNPRDRFFITVLFDSGCRISELLTMKLKDITQDEYSLILRVTGKTGERKVRCFGDSIPAFLDWLSAHPQRDNPNAYALVKLDDSSIDKKGNHEMMDYYTASKVIRTVKSRAGITKRIHAHQFRHTRATIYARDLKSAPLEKVMGWAPGSDMSKHYVHLSDTDVDRALLKVYGIEFDEEKLGGVERLPIRCERCDAINESDSRFCKKCGLPFNAKIAQEFDKLKSEQDEIVDVVSEIKGVDPLIKALLPELDASQKLKILNTLFDKLTEDPQLKSELVKAIRNKFT